ncbi:MAG TPA: hypothetical protein VIC82_12320 [Candidatus Nanopelagicales bacterium]|jgi:hypothetical protein
MSQIALRSTLAVCAALALAGCADANPVQAEANTVQQGLSAGATASVEGALQVAQSAVGQFRATSGADPTAAEFASMPDVAVAQKGVTFSYRVTATGACIAATTSTPPTVTRYATDTMVLPAGQSC